MTNLETQLKPDLFPILLPKSNSIADTLDILCDAIRMLVTQWADSGRSSAVLNLSMRTIVKKYWRLGVGRDTDLAISFETTLLNCGDCVLTIKMSETSSCPTSAKSC